MKKTHYNHDIYLNSELLNMGGNYVITGSENNIFLGEILFRQHLTGGTKMTSRLEKVGFSQRFSLDEFLKFAISPG